MGCLQKALSKIPADVSSGTGEQNIHFVFLLVSGLKSEGQTDSGEMNERKIIDFIHVGLSLHKHVPGPVVLTKAPGHSGVSVGITTANGRISNRIWKLHLTRTSPRGYR